MQSITDTGERLNKHIDGKLHQGYLKVRKVLQELKQEREEFRNRGERLRTPSPEYNRRETRRDDKRGREDGGWRGYFSSTIKGSGINMPEQDITNLRYADQVLQDNRHKMGVAVEAPDFQEIIRIKREKYEMYRAQS